MLYCTSDDCWAQAAVRYSCGSSCWSSWPTPTVSTSSRGRATDGSFASATRTRSPAAGAPARRSRRWTTKNLAADFATTTTRTSSTRRPVDDTCIGLSATLRTCWDAPLTSCFQCVALGLCLMARLRLLPIRRPPWTLPYKLPTAVRSRAAARKSDLVFSRPPVKRRRVIFGSPVDPSHDEFGDFVFLARTH